MLIQLTGGYQNVMIAFFKGDVKISNHFNKLVTENHTQILKAANWFENV